MACGTVTSPLRYKPVDHGTGLVDRVFRALLKLGAKPSDPKHEVCDETSRELHSLEPRMAKGEGPMRTLIRRYRLLLVAVASVASVWLAGTANWPHH